MQMAGMQLLIHRLSVEEKVTPDSLITAPHANRAGTVTFITQRQS